MALAALDLSSWADRNRREQGHKDAERLGDVPSSRKRDMSKGAAPRAAAPPLELEPITKPLRGRETGRQPEHVRSLSLSPSARQGDLAAKRAQYEQANAEYMALMKAAKAKKTSRWDEPVPKRADRLPSLPAIKNAIRVVDERPSARTPPPLSSARGALEGSDENAMPASTNRTTPPLPETVDDENGGYISGDEGDEKEKKPKMNRIRVVVRKRPLNDREGGDDCVECLGSAVHVNNTKLRVDLSEYQESHHYAFDDACGDEKTNRDVYECCARDLITTVFEGGSASCFAYGQTGSGKTYTMIGNDTEPGIYILAAEDIFARCGENHRVFVSLYEIYCNMLYDLLNSHNLLQAREDGNKRINICGLTWHEIRNVKDLLRVIDKGMKERRTGSTSANEFSSRSHAVMTITLRDEDQPKFIGSLNVVDLAGSERAADTAANDKQTRLEGAEINKSLLALKECIRGLDEAKKHIPFRGTKLTEVLRDSFVGNSRTAMIATVSPSSINAEHTLNTLRYAHRVKGLSVDCPMPSTNRKVPPRPAQPSRADVVDMAAANKKEGEKRDRDSKREKEKRKRNKGRTPRKHYVADAAAIDPKLQEEMKMLRDQMMQAMQHNAELEGRVETLAKDNVALLQRVVQLEANRSTLPPISTGAEGFNAFSGGGGGGSRPQSENRASRRSRRKHRDQASPPTSPPKRRASAGAATEELVTLEELAS